MGNYFGYDYGTGGYGNNDYLVRKFGYGASPVESYRASIEARCGMALAVIGDTSAAEWTDEAETVFLRLLVNVKGE